MLDCKNWGNLTWSYANIVTRYKDCDYFFANIRTISRCSSIKTTDSGWNMMAFPVFLLALLGLLFGPSLSQPLDIGLDIFYNSYGNSLTSFSSYGDILPSPPYSPFCSFPYTGCGGAENYFPQQIYHSHGKWAVFLHSLGINRKY